MKNKIAIVTGAARGIGQATSQLLTEQGWQVAMVDRDTDALNLAMYWNNSAASMHW